MNKFSTKKLATMAMLIALAYLLMMFVKIPMVMFLKYEPKDIVITIGGFIYGPLEAFVMSAVVSIIEMFTVSETGWIGAIMNLVSTCSFACVAALIYKKKHTLGGAIGGLIAGFASMTVVMILWNYILTPIYLNYDRAVVAAMIPTVFLPFNAIKGGLNAAITMLIYKPVVIGLRRAGLVEHSASSPNGEKRGISIGVMIGSAVAVATFVLLALVLAGVI